MQFKIGDRVKFLNESGGGVVSRIEGLLIFVEIEDGFEIPTQGSNLVKVDAASTAARFFDEDFGLRRSSIRDEESTVEPEAEERYSQKLTNRANSDASRFAKGIYLAIVPQEQRVLIAGLVDIYLINHTGSDVLYNLYLKKADGRMEGTDFGSVEPESLIHLFEVDRNELMQWNEGVIQVLFHDALVAEVPAPLSSLFRVKPARMMKEDNYVASPWFDERAVVIYVAEASVSKAPDAAQLKELSEKFGQEATPQKAKIVKHEALIDQHQTRAREAEVDLHISALCDDYSGMSNHAILRMQQDYFLRTLESAQAEGYHRVFYIHGIGNGTLRKALMDALKAFEDVRVSSAPFAQYGNGAIEVTFTTF